MNNLEGMMFYLIDQVKTLLSQDIWNNILLNCTKNEMLILLQLYRGTDINMSQIAEYLDAPLNTTTGIVGRMEKKGMLHRVRSESDKRVVTIVLTTSGEEQINEILKIMMGYGEQILGVLSSEEIDVLMKLSQKTLEILKGSNEVKQPKRKIRKIMIE